MTGLGKKVVLLLALWAGLVCLFSSRAKAVSITNTVPIFQYEVFYDLDLEVRPGPNMGFNGNIQCNRDIYLSSGGSLIFSNDVSASGNIYYHKKDGDQQSEGGGTTTFLLKSLTNAAPFNLAGAPFNLRLAPPFTNGLHGKIDVPPVTEASTSAIGVNRLFNQVDMTILISNATVSCKSGIAVNGATTTITNWPIFLMTNFTGSFYNVREGATVRAVVLDIGKLKIWSQTNIVLRPLLGYKDISSIFIADMRTMNATQEAGICLTNGRFLPSRGLTVVSPAPVYTIGDFNTTDDGSTFYPGTSDTTHTRPAAIICDAINILSRAFDPHNFTATNSLTAGKRNASSAVTVNAAVITGIVQTTNIGITLGFSGGVENFFRLHEDWSGSTFTYNGSMVVLYDSVVANKPWLGTGAAYNSYNPPVRNWFFDAYLMDPFRLPPLTPRVMSVTDWPLPLIATQPVATNGPIGQSVTFSVLATNTSSIHYQWYFNTNTLLSGATNSVLTLPSLQTNQAGVYDVVVTNPAGAVTSSFVVLTIVYPPSFASQPQDILVRQGDTTGFYSTINGTPPFQFQWRKGTTNISGQTSSSLVLNNVQSTDAGSYAVVVTNTCGSITSRLAALTLGVSPIITTNPTSKVVPYGQSATFIAGAAGLPAPVFIWLKNGIPTTNTGPVLTFAAVTQSDGGVYSVVASNLAGTVTSAIALLSVNSSPVVTQQPTNRTVECGQPVTLTASVNFAPPGTYQWFYFTNAIIDATNAALFFNSVAAANAGDYALVVSNSFGSVTTSNATLTVSHLLGPTIPALPPVFVHAADQTGAVANFAPMALDACDGPVSVVCQPASGTFFPAGTNVVTETAIDSAGNKTTNSFLLVVQTPPVLTNSPSDQSVSVGQSVTFSAGAIGNPSPVLSWQKDGVSIGTQNNTLNLGVVTVTNAGNYTVMANNPVAVVSNTFILTVTTADTSIALNSLPWSSQLKQIHLSASISAPGDKATGQVEFKEDSTSLGIAPVNSAFATLSNVSLTMGNHTITAYYLGDANYNPSVSSPAVQRVGLFFQPIATVTNGTLLLNGSGAPGQTGILDESDGLQSPMIWTPIATNPADGSGYFHFSQTVGTNEAVRLYRLRLSTP